MTVRRILFAIAIGFAILGSPAAAARADLGASLLVFFGGILLAATIAFWPSRRSSRS